MSLVCVLSVQCLMSVRESHRIFSLHVRGKICALFESSLNRIQRAPQTRNMQLVRRAYGAPSLIGCGNMSQSSCTFSKSLPVSDCRGSCKCKGSAEMESEEKIEKRGRRNRWGRRGGYRDPYV